MGGNDLRRGRGRMISLGMVDSVDKDVERDRECGGDCDSRVAGSFLDAAVEGLMSCSGDGLRFIETD